MGRYVIAQVSQSALRHNLQQVRKFAPHAKIIAMVKANAYGHGLRLVGKTLAQADALGVASIEEGMRLRQVGVKTEIVLMEGFFRPEELDLIQTYHFTLVIHHIHQIQALQNYQGAIQEKFKIWIKINTGMNRLGFAQAEFEAAWDLLSHHKNVNIIGFMTHFSHADERQNDLTSLQYQRFTQIIGSRPGEKSVANSAGILAWPAMQGDWVRPGLMLYGASPFSDVKGKDLALRPAMSLGSEIIAIRQVKPGEKVGYCGTWESAHSNKIAIVAIGYGDGYPWHAQNGTPVLVNNQRVGTVGRVSMDMLAVDVSSLPEVKVGDKVVLWGENLPIEEVAAHAGTIPYELFCRFTERVTVEVVS